MFRLRRLKLKNFLSFQEAEVDLHKGGLYLISGYNAHGSGSNGSGKSTLLNAIAWALFNRTSTGLKASEIQNWHASESARVELEIADETNTYLITRTPSSLTFLINGSNPYTAVDRKREVQDLINETFNTSYELFINSTMFSSGKADFITEAGDTTRKKLFKIICGLDKIDQLYEKSRLKLDALKVEADRSSSSIAEGNRRVDWIGGEIQDALSKQKNFENQRAARIFELEARKQAGRPESDPTLRTTYSSYITQYQNLLQDVKDLEKWNDENQELVSKLYSDAAVLKSRISDNEMLLSDIRSQRGTKCRLCGGMVTKGSVSSHVQEIENQNQSYQQKLQQIQGQISAMESKLDCLGSLRQEVTNLKDRISHVKLLISQEESQHAAYEETSKSYDNQIQSIMGECNPWMGIIESKKLQLQSTCKELSDLETTLTQVTKDIDMYGYLKWVFSREGVASQIIESTFSRLESLANRYLSYISTEGFKIHIKPQKELKSGALREEISIVIRRGSEPNTIPYWALSGGQRQRLNIALLVSIFQLCRDLKVNNFDFLLLDEVLDLSLDQKGQEDMVRLMRRLLDEVHNVFIISHKTDISDLFDYQIEVRRDSDDFSRVV